MRATAWNNGSHRASGAADLSRSTATVPGGTRREIEVAAFGWVDFLNTDRPHEYLADARPARPRNSTTLTRTHTLAPHG